ncbi:CHAT domain-containing protein [Streptomyces antibioticus]|uniref:CHAT domain-containing protein n=1 Tax=Streptomyces antibioticus TaxID=1890 RepID=UPI0033D7DE47
MSSGPPMCDRHDLTMNAVRTNHSYGGGRVDGGARSADCRAGYPDVVGTLWPTPDATGRRLARHFHRRLAEGDDPERALHRTTTGCAATPPVCRSVGRISDTSATDRQGAKASDGTVTRG